MNHVPGQSSFLNFGGSPNPTDRLFFAVLPDIAVAKRVAQFAHGMRNEYNLKGKLLAPDRFHVTLYHIGDYEGLPGRIVTIASEAAATVAMPPFDITFDRAGSFSGRPGNLPFVLRGRDGVVALIAFQRVLATAMMKAGLKSPGKSGFTPHMTLLYDERYVPEQAAEVIGWTVALRRLQHPHGYGDKQPKHN